MKIRMLVEISGTRNGQSWPGRGGVVEVSDTEGAQMCAAHIAEPVVDDKVETAVAPKAEERGDDAPAKPRRGRPPGSRNRPKSE